jgi:HK97 gp10 family phage protein
VTYVWNSSSNVGGEFAHVSGLRELRETLRQLPKAIETNVLRGAVRAGANVIAEEARRRVPVRTGQLKASIRVSTRVSNGCVMCFVKAGSRYTVFKIGKKAKRTKDSYRTNRADGGVDYHASHYAFWVEFGTSKMASRPFMRPAFESQKDAAVTAMVDYMRQRIPNELAKLGVGR